MKLKYPLIPLSILILCILIFGFTFNTTSENKAIKSWSEGALDWDDFKEVNTLEEDYVATIYSDIICPDLITETDSKVYAFMNPNSSERLRNEYDSYNVLVHEQYHFNLTEYCARLLRKDIVEKGIGGLSFQTIKSLKTKYSKKLDSLQTLYDSITDHNSDMQLQRFWELQIDDWLRETASYQNEDIYGYYNFTKNRTNFYKSIYFTHSQRVLTSYPEKNDTAFGAFYQIEYPKYGEIETTIKFYKDGKLTNGGYFESAITKILEKEKDFFEVHYYNPDESYNTNKTTCIRKIKIDKNKNKVEQFYTEAGVRGNRNAVYEIKWSYNQEEKSYYTTYYDKKGMKISNKNGIFHEKHFFDEKNRTVILENFGNNHLLKNDDSYIARYETSYSEDNKILLKRLYDESGDFAFHKSDYHLAYEYDEWGHCIKITSLDANGNRTYDHNGASIYEYTYDIYDRQTSVKRYNVDYQPIIANDDYFQKITDYDAKGRITFSAEYYPEYVLKFSDKKDGALKYNYINDTIIKIYNVDAYNTIFENDHNVAVTKQTLNLKEQVVKEIYYDANENFAKTDDGAVSFRYNYNSQGNQIENAAYDSIGKPIEFEADVATIRWEYDTAGNKLKTTYFNKNNELAIAKDSVTYNIYSYNNRNELSQRTNYNIQMKPSEIDGVFKSVLHTNKAGLDSLILDYNSENKLKKGVAIKKYFYNKYNSIIRVAYFDHKNRRTQNENGISAIDYIYNERQLIIGYEYLDVNNKLTNNQYGVALEINELDNLGHTLTYMYYDKFRKPVIGDFGYHRVDYEWSSLGETTKSTIYGTDMELIADKYGTAIYDYKLAPSGMIQTIERHDQEGNLASNTENVAITHYDIGLNGLYFIAEELDAFGKVVNDSIIN